MLSLLCYACVSFFPSSLHTHFGLSVVTWSASAILCFHVVAKRSAEGVVSGLRSGHDEVGKGGMGITGGCTSLSGDSSPHNILSTYLDLPSHISERRDETSTGISYHLRW